MASEDKDRVNSIIVNAGRNKKSLENILDDPLGQDYFMKYLTSAYCEENLGFWLESKKFKTLKRDAERRELAQKLFDQFLRTNAPNDIGMEHQIKEEIEKQLNSPDPLPDELFDAAQAKILFLMKANSYTNFLDSDFFSEMQRHKNKEEEDRAKVDESSGDPYEEEHDKEDIIFESNKEVKGGNIERLVERLTYEKKAIEFLKFHRTFLLTYRSFMKPKELMIELQKRFDKPTPAELPPEQVEDWTKKIKFIIRLRVIKTLKDWVDGHYYDFENDQELLDLLAQFLNHVEASGMVKEANMIRELLKRQQAETSRLAHSGPIFTTKAPAPISHKKIDTIIDVDPLEMARQLTLLESTLFRAIRPHEFLNQNWGKPGREFNSPNILIMIEWFNKVSLWAATTMVLANDNRDRVQIIKKWIDVAEECRKLNNLNSVMELLGGLRMAAVSRLKKSWDNIDAKHLAVFKKLEDLMSSLQNYKQYRETMNQSVPPCIPYLGIYLRDLTFIGDGNPNNFENGLINFDKRRMVAAVIYEKVEYSQAWYNLKEASEVQNFIRKCQHMNENALYKHSLLVEPKTRTPSTSD